VRNPLSKTVICLGLTITGVVSVLFCSSRYEQLGNVASTIFGLLGISLAIIPFMIAIWSCMAAVGYARLCAGKGLIARWHITAEQWDRFRAFDAIRAAQDLALRNDLHIRRLTPPAGVDVLVGRRQLIVDGSYHSLRRLGNPSLRHVYWLPAPADPECLEFAVEYARSRGGTLNLSLRLPVPAHARTDGMRVFEHYNAIVSPSKP
jgi:hypothetical protein